MPDVRTECPACGKPVDWPIGQTGPILCLRCGAQIQEPAFTLVDPGPEAVIPDEAVIPLAEPLPPAQGATVGPRPDEVSGGEASPDLDELRKRAAARHDALIGKASKIGAEDLVEDPPPRATAWWAGWAVAGVLAVACLLLLFLRRPPPATSPDVLTALPVPAASPQAAVEPVTTDPPAAATPTTTKSDVDEDLEEAEPAPPEPAPPEPAPAAPAPQPVRALTPPPDPQTRPVEVAPMPASQPVLVAVGPTSRPAPVRLSPVVHGVTDEQIGAAIQSGVNWILGAAGEPERAGGDRAARPAGGPNAAALAGLPPRLASGDGEAVLCLYALLQCGKAINDPRLDVRSPLMSAAIDAAKLVPDYGSYNTYARAIRANVLALYNRPQDRRALAVDVNYLADAHRDGAYSYGSDAGALPKPSSSSGRRRRAAAAAAASAGHWDNSNSQYGLLGVWAGAEAGLEIRTAYWQAVANHWRNAQLPNGQWTYSSYRATSGGTTSMTAAGTASLFVAEEYLELANPGGPNVGRPPLSEALARAMRWWGEGDNALAISGHWGYTLYGIERVGLASGYKHLGKHDWYRELAAKAVASQAANGSWGDEPINTAFALLFLARGRHPVLMNKLAYDGFWANRPRDTANLARQTGKRLEREFNWQIVSADADWADWLDSPILYVAGHVAPKFGEDELKKIRAYVEAGGMLFTHADAGAEEFNRFAADFASKLFPSYELTDLPAGHPLYSVLFDIKPEKRPPLKAVRNGARLLMVHSPAEVARAWQRRETARAPELFELGANLFIYAAGKRDFRNRLDVGRPDPHPAAPTMIVPVARLRYAGNWDPEPGAWRHYASWFKLRTGMELKMVEVPLKQLHPDVAPIAHLTGTSDYRFTDEERAALKAYVKAGGVVVADACGGGRAFAEAVRGVLPAVFPDAALAGMPKDHPLLNDGPAGMEDLTTVQLRLSTLDRRGAKNHLEVLRAGRGAVLLAPFDLTCGLLDLQAWDVRGYAPAYAQNLMKNTIFWTLDGQPTPTPPGE